MTTRAIQTINPATGEKLENYELFSEDKALSEASKAKQAFENWRKTPIGEREQYLRRLADVLRSKKSEYGRIMTLEMGKPITQAEAEVEKCAWAAEYYSENSEKWLAEEVVATDAESSYVVFESLGVVLSIMPWNYPFWQAFRFAMPTVAAGNTSILRHASVCPGSALAIEESFTLAGFPDNIFSTVITDHAMVAKLIESDLISGVSLTGSTIAGQRVAELAATNFKKFVLELGGSDPFIVLDDANIDRAAQVGATARLQNTGQSCICAKRFIVAKSVVRQFTEKLVHEFEKKKVGNPLDRTTDVGPLVNAEAVILIDELVKDAVAKGASTIYGGSKRSPGFFYEPTILDKVDKRMRVMYEEVFGPVASICVVEDDAQAIRVANDTEFGLGASLWTNNIERAKRLVGEIQSGMVFVNELTKSDPRMPFGGVKRSGMGRELSKYGLKEFVNVKSVNIYGI